MNSKMKRQVVIEIAAFFVGGIVLVLFLLNLNFEYLALLLTVEYFISIIGTICWLTWVDEADEKANNQEKARAALSEVGK